MFNNDLKPLGDNELEMVNGGSEIIDSGAAGENSDPLSVENKLTWCGACKKMVRYHEFTGGRNICDICGNFVKA